jgi:hypothetical protein
MLVSRGLSGDDRATVHYGGLKDLYQSRVGRAEGGDRFPLQIFAGLGQMALAESVRRCGRASLPGPCSTNFCSRLIRLRLQRLLSGRLLLLGAAHTQLGRERFSLADGVSLK